MRRFDLRWLLFVLPIAACSPEIPSGSDVPNQAPSVWLAADPPQASGDTYSVRFHWGGADPDGQILHYEYLIVDHAAGVFDFENMADATWTSISSSEFTFVMPSAAASEATTGPSATTPVYTLFIRAVDNEFMPSPEPDYISFTPKNLLPAVRITVPPVLLGLTPADVPSISTFEWGPVSGRPEPDSVQFALVNTVVHGNSYAQTINYLRSLDSAPDWYPWVWYDGPKGREWTTPPLEFGNYVFAIRAKTVTNAINLLLVEPVNVRRIKVQARVSGPTLAVQNPLFGHIISASCDYPLTIIDQAANLPTSFTFSACADNYGGTVEAYRYGWDILDLEDPTQWEVGYTFYTGPVTTVPRTYAFGTHVFSIEVIDNSGFCSRVQVRVNIVRFTGERNLLIVDDFRPDDIPGQSGWTLTNGAMPSDAEHDAFWLDMVSDVDQFDPVIDMVTVTAGIGIPIATLAQYRNIIWNAYGNVETRDFSSLPFLYTFILYRASLVHELGSPCSPTGGVSGEVPANAIALAMRSGVHVLITGNHPVQNVVPRYGTLNVRWPMLPLYELEPGATQFGTEPRYLAEEPGGQGFAYQELSLEAIDFAFLTPQRARLNGVAPNQRYCGITGLRTINANSRRDDTMRSGLPIDPSFPALSLRPEVAAPGRFYAPASQGLDVEVYNPTYFRQGGACAFVTPPRGHFDPIYGLVCLDTGEPTYQQPVAFWAGAYAPVTGDFPGAVAARSAVFGFAPVYFHPYEIKPAIEHILFDEWQLPRSPVAASGTR